MIFETGRAIHLTSNGGDAFVLRASSAAHRHAETASDSQRGVLMPRHFFEGALLYEDPNRSSDDRSITTDNDIVGDHAHEVRG
jgi:hypothetical protein